MNIYVISRNSNGKRRLCNCGLRLVYTEVFVEVNKGGALDFDVDGLLSRVEAVKLGSIFSTRNVRIITFKHEKGARPVIVLEGIKHVATEAALTVTKISSTVNELLLREI